MRDEIFFDSTDLTKDLIVQQNGDGGDTAQREGLYWTGQAVRPHVGKGWYGAPRKTDFKTVMDHLEHQQTGRFLRHPGQLRHRNPDCTSRDQVMPLIAAMSLQGDWDRLARLDDRLRKDGYWLNGDMLIAFKFYIQRARDHEFSGLGDNAADERVLDEAVNLRFAKIKDDWKKDEVKGKDDVGDDLNLIMQLLLPALRKPKNAPDRPSIRLKYAEQRPANYGCYLTAYRAVHGTFWNTDSGQNEAIMRKMASAIEEGIAKHGWKPDCNPTLGVFKWYFRAEAGGGPGMAEMYRPIIDTYFGALPRPF